jgi:putative acetyltransferase
MLEIKLSKQAGRFLNDIPIKEENALMISITSPNQPDVIALLCEADAYYATLYPAESNHLLDIAALEKPEVTFLTARSEKLLGIGAIVETQTHAEIKRMFVVAEARGLRIGQQILAKLIALSTHKIIRLETGIKQMAAIKLYQSAGFYAIEAFEPYEPDENSLFMELRLI